MFWRRTLLEETRALRKALTSERAEREHLEKQVQIILRDSKAQMQQGEPEVPRGFSFV